MENVLHLLMERTSRMEKLFRFFTNKKVSKSAKNNFTVVIRQGKKLQKDVEYTWAFTGLRNEVENFLIASEDVVIALALESKTEACELIDVLDDFRYERFLVIKHLDCQLGV
jgi:hypothetical protein